MKKNTQNKNTERREITFEEGMALLRKTFLIEKENGVITEKEKEYWARPENLKILVEEFRIEKNRKYNNIWSISYKCLVAVLLLTLVIILTPFFQNFKIMLLKALFFVCAGASLWTSYLIFNWFSEGASGKYTFKMFGILFLWFGILFILSFLMNPSA